LPASGAGGIFAAVDGTHDRNGPPEPPEHVPARLEDLANNYLLLIFAFACYLMATSVAGLLYLAGNVALSVILPGIVGYVVPLAVIAKRYGASFREQFRLHAPDTAMTVVVLAIAASSIYPVDSLTWLFERGRPEDSDYINILLAFKPKGALHFAGMALGIAVITPIGEELLYRGLVQSVLHRNMRPAFAVALAGLLFAIAHGTLYLIPGTAALGVLIGFVFYRTGSLVYPVMIHALFNAVSLVRLHMMSEEAIRASEWSAPSAVVLLGTSAVLAGALYVFHRSTSRAAGTGGGQ